MKNMKKGKRSERKQDDNQTIDGLSTHNNEPIETIGKLQGKRPQVDIGMLLIIKILRKNLKLPTFSYIYSFSIL